MKVLAILTLAAPAIIAAALPEADPLPAENYLIKRTTCTRKLAYWPDKHGVCVNTAIKSPQCTGGELYKADCGKLGATWYCCII